jgi:hypothetical protein
MSAYTMAHDCTEAQQWDAKQGDTARLRDVGNGWGKIGNHNRAATHIERGDKHLIAATVERAAATA